VRNDPHEGVLVNGVEQSTSHAVPFTPEVDGIVGPLSIPGLPDEFENEKRKARSTCMQVYIPCLINQ